MRRLGPRLNLLVLFVAVIPYIPLVKGQIDIFSGVFFCLHCVTDRYNSGNEVIHPFGGSEKIRRITAAVSVILMQG